eukprot:scaffold6381_cov69-Cyclotella_meneghiniana.AAC.2
MAEAMNHEVYCQHRPVQRVKTATPALLHFKFDGFAELPADLGRHKFSKAKTDCNGNEWRLQLYPGGRSEAAEKGWVALSLHFSHKNKCPVEAKVSICVENGNNEAIVGEINGDISFNPGYYWGNNQYIKRARIIDPDNHILRDGALCIDVTIQVKDKKEEHYDPECKLSHKMLKLLESGDRSDASFKVGECTFPVHSLILHSNAPILANYLGQNPNSDVIVDDISEVTFKLLLKFVYAEHRPSDEEILDNRRALIDAANRFELPNLKMAVEHVLVRERILTRKNVSDYILFADAQSCPLLKEYAITYFLLNLSKC